MRHQGRLAHLIRADQSAQITGWSLGGCFFGDMTEFAVWNGGWRVSLWLKAAKAVLQPPVSLPRNDSSSHPGPALLELDRGP
jgi:ribosome modulation factor